MSFKTFATSLMVTGSVISTDAVLSQQSSSGFVLEEVVVTARKREENLQNTPVAVEPH